MSRFLALTFVCFAFVAERGIPQATRPSPPARDPNTPGYVTAKELPDGAVPPANVDGNFIIGPTHNPAPEMTAQDGVPHGNIHNFSMSSADSKIYPGIARDPGTFGTRDPKEPATLIVTTSHPARTPVELPSTFLSNTSLAQRLRLSSARMDPTSYCSQLWTI